MEKADMAPFFLGERGVVAGRPYTWKGRCYVAVPCHVQGSASTSEKEFCFVTIVELWGSAHHWEQDVTVLDKESSWERCFFVWNVAKCPLR
jgi:hypothetical protein